MSTQQPNYENPETKDRLDEAREQWQEQERGEDVGINALDALEAATTREALAREEQPGIDTDLPQPDTKTEEWRGTPLQFDELGDAPVTLSRLRNNPDVGDAEVHDYIYELLEEKCHNDAADEAYWRQFDIMTGEDEKDGILDLFLRLTGEEEIPDDVREAAEKFREE